MWSAGSSSTDGGGRVWGLSAWSVPIAGLVGLWLWLAFSSGGYVPLDWLPASLALGLFGLVISLLAAYPRRPGQLSLVLLTIFGVYAVWVAFSAVWAQSTTRVWMESGRTFTYLLVFALALVYFTDVSARRVFRYSVIVAALVLLLACIIKLWSTNNLAALFVDGKRFAYPVSAPNHAGALFLVSFWPLMWLASASKERAFVRGLALGIATGLLGLAVMTQSRGAIWSLGLSMVLMFVISPARLRLLFYLVVPALMMVYVFPVVDRYWVQNPQAVGGTVGARSLLVAAIIAGLVGLVVALLEHWIKVSRRMKAIFGTVILVAVTAGAVFWVVTSTGPVGGPIKWVSQAWRQFTASTETAPTPTGVSRFALVSSTGRVQIWRVALEEFESAPVRGVGADNFVFEYYRLRPVESYKPQQAHSLELQVLGETGVVGGVFLLAGVLLALGACLWPRCTAGWRGSRASRPRSNVDSTSSGIKAASSRWCNPRWGDDAGIYGWEMALIAGTAYWLVHASVDWIWQMAGVTIPAFVFLAAAVASVDARAGVLWPRAHRFLMVGAPASTADGSNAHTATGPTKQEGRDGLLSQVFRALVVTLAAVLLLVAGLPYLSLKLNNSALALARTDAQQAVQRASATRYLLPADPTPYLTEASIYERAATQAVQGAGAASAGAVLDDLALEIGSYEEAIGVEPADWTSHYHAGIATLNMILARSYAEGWGSARASDAARADMTTLEDWSGLAGAKGMPASSGVTPGSLAQDDTTRALADEYRQMTKDDLVLVASGFLSQAKERNPLASQIDQAIQALDVIKTADQP